MKKTAFILISLAAMFSITSCDDEETYADQKEREAKQINSWLDSHNIDVVSVVDFLKDTITNNSETGPDFSKNEYVLFSDNGVYMQIVRRGEGRQIEPDEMWNLNARYVEVYVSTGDSMTMNLYQPNPDVINLTRTGDNYKGSFVSGVMSDCYGNSVPNAWLMAMPFIKPGFLNGASSAKIRLIVPHNQGTQQAAQSVYPAYYEIILSTQKWQ